MTGGELCQNVRAADCVPSELESFLPPLTQGQFIYAKYAFDELRAQSHWTVPELEAALPKGLYGVYSHVLGILQAALADERPDLLHLMRASVLPILVAAEEPLTAGQVARLAAAEQLKVCVGRKMYREFASSAGGVQIVWLASPHLLRTLMHCTAAGMDSGRCGRISLRWTQPD